ncbi:MAG: ABC transporter ATP-binding protein [Nitrospinota bacterium]
MTPLLQVSALVKHFPVTTRRRKVLVRAVNGVSFDIQSGKTLGLVGESGSGKTTVGRCIVGLEQVTSGTINFKGEKVSDLSGKEFRSYRSRIQIVFQEPHDSLNPRMRVVDTILEPVRIFYRQLSPTAQKDKMEEIVRQIGLTSGILELHPHHLSGGQAQRVAIGRAIVPRPDLLVLDEPTSALDPSARAEIMRLLIRLQKDLGLTYLFISHDLATVRFICSEVAVMYLGKIVERGPTDALFRNPRHPYSRALLSSYLVPDPNARRSPLVLKGEIPSPINLPNGCYLYSRCPLAAPKCDKAHPPLEPVGNGRFAACYRLDAVDTLPGGQLDTQWAVRTNPIGTN